MPWYLDELGRSDEVEWYFAEDQNIPDAIVLAKTVPDRQIWPLRVIQTGYVEDRGQSEIPDFTVGPVLGTVVVSRRFKYLVEQFDPEKHHFIPLEIHRPDGEIWRDTHYLFKFGSFVESGIIVEKSDVNPNIRNGKIRTYLRTAQRPRLMWNAEAIAGRHVWADKFFGGAVIVSDQFYEKLKENEMGSFTALECRVE